DRETDGAAGRAVAPLAWRRGAPVVGLLPGDEAARGRDRRKRPAAITRARVGLSRPFCAIPNGIGFAGRETAAKTAGEQRPMLDRTDDISTAAENWLAQFERALAKPDD